ncbi:MAG: class I adenylate-forming enzyme family protein [Proteobacteria bacterium]|nr:class I adenylate-forming enzyme family protein [Pseudomonadota bacterium]
MKPFDHADAITAALRHRAEIEAAPLPAGVSALLEDAVRRVPERLFWVSIEGDGKRLTYRAFHDRVMCATAGLAVQGIAPGAVVAIALPSVPEAVIAWFALARLGASVVPLNPALTGPELVRALQITGAEALLADAEALSTFAPPCGGLDRSRVFCRSPATGTEWRSWADVESAGTRPVREAATDLDRPLILQFTSGSTGLPKACVLSQRYWLQIGRVIARRGPPVERILVDQPLFYLAGQWRVMMALTLGATLFVAPRYSLSRFVSRLIEHRIEFATVNDAAAKLDPPAGAGFALKRIMLARLSPMLQERVERTFGAPAREGYGLTETGATLYMPYDNDLMVGSGSCGIAAPFREVRVMDGAGNEVPPGTAGELHVRGAGIMAGYWRDPDANAGAFRGDWFRTGDLATRNADGYHFIVGRSRDVVRRSGETVPAAEVEAVLLELPGVVQAAVIGVPDVLRGEEVKAYLELAAGVAPADLPPERVFAHCAARLAPFKVPRYLQYADRLPRTASQKIAKTALLSAGDDLRDGSFDRLLGQWLGPSPV